MRDTDRELEPTTATMPHVKQLKSTSADLRRLFDDRVTARYITESFVAFDSNSTGRDVRSYMEHRGFDIIGVRHHGAVVGYVDLKDLTSGTLGDHIKRIDDSHCVEEAEPLMRVVTLLATTPRVYVEVWGQVSGIITRGDLQKAPVRMWFFALLSLLEMQFLRLIRSRLPDDDWPSQLKPAASRRIRAEFRKKLERNEETDLADCTVLSDKVAVIAATKALRGALGFASGDAMQMEFIEIIKLRNDLAHGRDIVHFGTASLARIATRTEELLNLSEGVA